MLCLGTIVATRPRHVVRMALAMDTHDSKRSYPEGYVAHGKNMTARLAKQAANALAIAEYNLANPQDLIAV